MNTIISMKRTRDDVTHTLKDKIRQKLEQYHIKNNDEYKQMLKILDDEKCKVFEHYMYSTDKGFLTRHFCLYNAMQINKVYNMPILLGYFCQLTCNNELYAFSHAVNLNTFGSVVDFTYHYGPLKQGEYFFGIEIEYEEAQKLIIRGEYRGDINPDGYSYISIIGKTIEEIDELQKKEHERLNDFYNNFE